MSTWPIASCGGFRIDGKALILIVRDDRQQLLDPFAALRSHDAELGQMRSQCVDELGTLAHQQIARAMLHHIKSGRRRLSG